MLLDINWDSVGAELYKFAWAYGPKLLLAIATLIFGLMLIKFLVKLLGKALTKSSDDPTLNKFLKRLVAWVLKIILFVSIAGMVGIETTSFIAVLGAMGLAIGLALQGALSNFAGGVLIMLFKPFKVGDFVQTQGELGTIQSVQIFNTVLLSGDNKTIILPNGPVINGNITNFTKEDKRRVDIVIGIDYGADIRKAKEVIREVVLANPLVLEEPEPKIAVAALADSSININVRPWVATDKYWDLHSQLLEDIKYALDAAEISIPFPHVTVDMKNPK